MTASHKKLVLSFVIANIYACSAQNFIRGYVLKRTQIFGKNVSGSVESVLMPSRLSCINHCYALKSTTEEICAEDVYYNNENRKCYCKVDSSQLTPAVPSGNLNPLVRKFYSLITYVM